MINNDFDFLPIGYGMRVDDTAYTQPQEMEEVDGYEVDIDQSEVRCPCCGKLLKPVNKFVDTEEFIGESKLNERWENDYLTHKVQDVAYQLYDEELADVQPETDDYGNVTREYLERFEYSSPQLRKAVKRAATKLSNDLKEDGFNINPWYCEQEIYDALKCFSK